MMISTAKTALVTGASRGIGEAIANALAERGAYCVLSSRKPAAIAEAAAKITAKGHRATSIACHTGDLDQIRNLVAEMTLRFGKLDILVNNAATSPQVGPMLEATESAWDKTYDVNVKGPFFLTHQAISLMVDAGAGTIINIASIEGVRPGDTRGVYSMTKGAVVSMTRSWARELAESNIRVNAALPGLVATRMARTVIDDPKVNEQYMKDIPMHRPGKPDELAQAALFLGSGASSYMTGSLWWSMAAR
jgi:NAD(P)-dependent dehydrogenase (short-subunit alcohol dehydrogenase family)